MHRNGKFRLNVGGQKYSMVTHIYTLMFYVSEVSRIFLVTNLKFKFDIEKNVRIYLHVKS